MKAVAAASVFAATASLIPTAVKASSLERQELDQVHSRLAKALYTPIVVEVLSTTLAQMSEQGDAVLAQTRQRAEDLLLELADGALREGLHVGGNGLVTLYINQQGLQRLQGSKRAAWFGPAPEWHHRLPFTRDPASLQRLHDAVSAPGGAEIVVTLNIEGLTHEFRRDGLVTVPASDGFAVRKLAGTLRQAVAHISSSKAHAALLEVERGGPSAAQADPTRVRMVVGLRELLALTAHAAVRDVALVADPLVLSSPAVVDADVDDWVKRFGSADVVIQLKRPLPMGRLSGTSERAHAGSVQRTIDSVKSAARGASLLHGLPLLEGLYGRVTAEELALLRYDLRIARVSGARMDGSPASDVANSIMNFPLVWGSVVGGSELKGQGATVVVMDTGMQTDLNHFPSAIQYGTNRVTRQRCFSTTGTAIAGLAVTSVCPQPQTPSFDSAAPDSGHFTLSTCPYLPNTAHCNHGSQVAALAAGQKVYRPNYGYSLIATHLSAAYEADIWAYTVASKLNSDMQARIAIQDVAAALSDIINATTAGTTANKIVVNLSFAAPCDAALRSSVEYMMVQNAVAVLHGRGIPVVAATGNDNSRSELSFPSCVPKVIKVGSAPNSQLFVSNVNIPAYTRTAHQSNYADPAQYPGDVIFAVPGGGNTFGFMLTPANLTVPTIVTNPTNIYPAISGSTIVHGTSYAAPLVSGEYAVYKAAVAAASVYDMSMWFISPGRRYAVQDADRFGLRLYNGQPRYFHSIRFQSLQ